MKILLVLLFCLIFQQTFTQNCDKVLFTGRVVDTLQAQNFYNLMVINRTTGRGVFGQPDGYFNVYASENDSITLSIKGYPMYGLRIKADSNCQMRIEGILENRIFEQKEMIVRPLKTIQDIKKERESLAMRETKTVSGLQAINSPITFLYETFSKREKSKQWVAKMEYKDDKTRVIKELLRLYVSYDIVNLNEEQFEDFIYFLNIDEDFLKTSSDFELITFIKDKFDHFSTLYNIPTTE
jgi:hypothetical protein